MTRWADLPTTAEYFGVKPRLLRSMVFDGRIVKRKFGGKLIFDLDDLEASLRGPSWDARLATDGPSD